MVESLILSELYLLFIFRKAKVIVPVLYCHNISVRKKLNEIKWLADITVFMIIITFILFPGTRYQKYWFVESLEKKPLFEIILLLLWDCFKN